MKFRGTILAMRRKSYLNVSTYYCFAGIQKLFGARPVKFIDITEID